MDKDIYTIALALSNEVDWEKHPKFSKEDRQDTLNGILQFESEQEKTKNTENMLKNLCSYIFIFVVLLSIAMFIKSQF